jgi:hypothetical protein
MFAFSTHVILSIALGCMPGAARSPRGWDRPFDGAEYIPANVEFFLHVEDPAAVRARLEHHALRSAAAEVVANGALAQAWRNLAAAAGLDERDMFGLLLRDDATFAFRRTERGDVDWVAAAEVDAEAWARFAGTLEFRIGAPVHGAPVLTLPEQEISFARLASIVVAGPSDAVENGLFADALALVAGAGEGSLADDDDLMYALKLGEGDIGLFIRHAPPLGGTSALAADLGQMMLVLKHASSFANSPFGDSPRPTSVDRSLLRRLSEQATCVVAQPLEMPAGPLATFIRARLPQGALAPDVEDNLGERLFWLFVERPPPAQEPHAKARLLDLVLAVEIRDGPRGREQIDALCAGLAHLLNEIAFIGEKPVEEMTTRHDGELRTLPIGRALARLYPGLIDAQAVSLDWLTVEAPNASWWVLGSSGESVRAVAEVLPLPEVSEDQGRPLDLDWQLGFIRAQPAAAHIDRLRQALAKALPAETRDGRALDSVARIVATTLREADRCIWRAELPSRNSLRSTWVLHFLDESHQEGDVELRAVDRRE